MSIGIYAFLRIYFLSFGLSAFAQFRTCCQPSSAMPLVRSARRGLSGIECRPVQRVQRPGVCVGAWRGLPCIWARIALLPVVCSRSGCAGVQGGHRRGIWDEPVVGWSTPRVEKIKKRRFFGVRVANTHPTFTKRNLSDCASLQIFRKIQKDPFRSLDCGIIS